MNLDVLFNASIAIQLHVYAAMLAFFIGAAVLWRRKGNASHKRLGKVWVALMVMTALSSMFIHEIQLIGPFSPIHLVSIGTVISLYFAIKQVRSGDIAGHQSSMKWTYIGGMGIAGALAFMPGRMMFEVALEPLFETLFSGTGIAAPGAILQDNWQIPVAGISVILLVVFWKPITRLFAASN